jgi:flagellar hook-associated protein 3 FlgL
MRVDPSYITNLVGALNQTQSTAQQLTSELSSGVRVTSLSQDPLAAGENVLLLNQMQQDDSFTQSSTLVTGQLQVADSALGQVVNQLTQAISLATAANNGTMNATNRATIAGQLAGFAAKCFPWPTPATRANLSLRAEIRRIRHSHFQPSLRLPW